MAYSELTGLTGEAGDAQATLTWTATDPGGGGGGNGEGMPECPDGSAEYVDCAGTCFNNSDCASGGYDCCVDDGTCTDVSGDGVITSWMGDGWCDDGSWGYGFNCQEVDGFEFNCDD